MSYDNLNKKESLHDNHTGSDEIEYRHDTKTTKKSQERVNITKRQLLFITIIAGTLIGSFGGLIGYRFYQSYGPEKAENQTVYDYYNSPYSANNAYYNGLIQNPSTTSTTTYTPPEYAKGYRGGVNGTKLTQEVGKVIDEITESLKLSYAKNGQYPAYNYNQTDETIYISQITDKYGYFLSTYSPLECPRDNGYIVYKPIKNQKTEKYDSYKIEYCRDTELLTKSS